MGNTDSGNYFYPMPPNYSQPKSPGQSQIDPASTGNGLHNLGSNTITFQVDDGTTPLGFETIGTRSVTIL